jgi:general secretion pathway protein K
VSLALQGQEIPMVKSFLLGARMKLRRQRGVAVITALLLTTLAVTIVASLFWQQQVQVRSMENQRLQLQTRWILRGALDLSRLILNQDFSGLAEFHAAQRRLGHAAGRNPAGRLHRARTPAMAKVSTPACRAGWWTPNRVTIWPTWRAQSKVKTDELVVFQRLLTNLKLDSGLAQATANMVANAQVAATPPSRIRRNRPPARSRSSWCGWRICWR